MFEGGEVAKFPSNAEAEYPWEVGLGIAKLVVPVRATVRKHLFLDFFAGPRAPVSVQVAMLLYQAGGAGAPASLGALVALGGGQGLGEECLGWEHGGPIRISGA